MAESSILPSRPTLAVGGQDNASLASGLLELLVEENTNGLYRCSARFGNWGTINNTTDFLYFDRRTLDFGKTLQVRLSADPASVIFDGRIMALEASFPAGGAPELRVLAEDRLQDLRMTRRTRTFADLTDADILQQIASEHSLTPQIELNGPQHRVVAQVNQSNLAFVRERVRALDAQVWVSGNTFFAKQHTARPQATVSLTYQNGLREFTVLADLAHQRTSVAASGWDVAGKNKLTFEATEQVIRSELNGDESGAAILQQKLGARKEALAHTVPLSSNEAQAEAEAFFKLSARRFVVGRGVAEADARLRVGNRVELLRLGPLFSGKYYLCEVCHIFDGRGIRTEFTAERAGVGKG